MPDFLKNENFDWRSRQAAAFALNELMQCDFKNCKNFLNINGQVKFDLIFLAIIEIKMTKYN